MIFGPSSLLNLLKFQSQKGTRSCGLEGAGVRDEAVSSSSSLRDYPIGLMRLPAGALPQAWLTTREAQRTGKKTQVPEGLAQVLSPAAGQRVTAGPRTPPRSAPARSPPTPLPRRAQQHRALSPAPGALSSFLPAPAPAATAPNRSQGTPPARTPAPLRCSHPAPSGRPLAARDPAPAQLSAPPLPRSAHRSVLGVTALGAGALHRRREGALRVWAEVRGDLSDWGKLRCVANRGVLNKVEEDGESQEPVFRLLGYSAMSRNFFRPLVAGLGGCHAFV